MSVISLSFGRAQLGEKFKGTIRAPLINQDLIIILEFSEVI